MHGTIGGQRLMFVPCISMHIGCMPDKIRPVNIRDAYFVGARTLSSFKEDCLLGCCAVE